MNITKTHLSLGAFLFYMAYFFLRGAFAMGLNDAPSGERIHIGFFGRRNAGKSSVVNAVTNQLSQRAGLKFRRTGEAERYSFL